MTSLPRKLFVSTLALSAVTALAACGDDDEDAGDTSAPSATVAETTEPAAVDTTAAETTVAETTVGEPAWEGDANAAIGAVQGHLDSVHSSSAYYGSITGISVDPASGVGVIETTLTDAAAATSACVDAAMVAWGDPAALTRLDVIDANGNVLATGSPDTSCAAA